MLVTQQPVLKRFWYPVMPISQLETGPQSFRLLDQPLVLWLDEEGVPQATEDRCCHRSAQLSKGSVIEGNVRCPYHGWSFNGQGICVHVPQLEEEMIPRTYQIQAYRCRERYGYAWVCLGEPLQDIPEIPEAQDPQFRLIHQFYEPWNCAGLRLMENSFDNAHLSFVHAQSFGDGDHPVPASMELTETAEGFVFVATIPVKNPPDQQRNLGITEEMTIRHNRNLWYLPFTRKLHITYPNGLQHIIITSATPIDDRTSQIVQFCCRNDTEVDAPAADIIAFDRQVTLEDKTVLESTDPDVPLDLNREQHMAADKPGIIMRHRLAALLKHHGEVEQTQATKAL